MASFNDLLKGPIPGEHLTQDAKGKPWHRPPQYTNFDDAVEYIIDEVIPEKTFIPGIIVLAQKNIPLTTVVTTLMIGQTSKAKFSLDMALLLAGPVYKIMARILDEFEVSYLSGFESAEEFRAKLSGEDMSKVKAKPLTKAQETEIEAIAEEMKAEIPKGGLMGAPTEEEKMDIPMGEEETEEGLVASPKEEAPQEEETV